MSVNTDTNMDADTAPASSKTPKWLFVIGAVLTGFLVAGGQGYFIPADATITCGYGLGAIGGAAGALVTNDLLQKQDTNPTAKSMLTLVASLFVFGYWAACIAMLALPDIYTRNYGTPATRQETAIRWMPGGRHSCSGAVIAEVPWWIETVCLRNYVAPGTVLTLQGEQSSLGFHISRISF